MNFALRCACPRWGGLSQKTDSRLALPTALPEEQISENISRVWMLKGKMEFRLGSEQRVCGPGDVVVIPGGTEHEGWFREDTEVIDFFAPPREDFLLGGKLAYLSEVENTAALSNPEANLPDTARGRVRAGLQRAKREGKRLGRPPIADKLAEQIRAALAGGMSVRKTAAKFEVNPSTVQRIARPSGRRQRKAPGEQGSLNRGLSVPGGSRGSWGTPPVL